MEKILWLPDELQASQNPDTIIDFLNFFSPRIIHPKEKKRALLEWGKIKNIKITPEMLEKLEKTE